MKIVSYYPLGTGTTYDIYITDMGHGNCIGLFHEDKQPLLIDCGTRDFRKEINLTNFTKQRLDNETKKDLVVTHHHFDHYNLLNLFHKNYFNTIFLPALPQPSHAARVILQFISLASLARLKGYPLIREIITRGRHISPHVKGDSFTALSRNWKVLWPDYDIIDKRNRIIIARIRAKIKEVIEGLSDGELYEFKKIYRVLSGCFSNEPDYAEHFDYVWENISLDENVRQSLEEVENTFRTLANRASLVIEDEASNFLFTGDIDNTILNRHLYFDSRQYLLVETPHHGGYYGQAFDNLYTEYLVISRRNRYKPRCEYFQDLSWTFLVDTARIGNCVIKR